MVKPAKRKSVNRVNLWHLNPQNCGGHTTFAAHLYKGMVENGVDVHLYKIGKNTEKFTRDFGYEMRYQNMSLNIAKSRVKLDKKLRSQSGYKCANLIVAPSKPKAAEIDALIACGARMICHDPVEFKHGWDYKSVKRPIVIRESMLQYFDDAVYLKHPYSSLRMTDGVPGIPMSKRKWLGVSTSRIDFRKNIDIILGANRLLEKKDQIKIFGSENRLYTKYTILPKFPEWVQSVSKYPRELRYAAQKICQHSTFLVDMTELKGDGGGTQYTFLEGIDAGCCLILNSAWILKGGLMQPGHNCLAAGNEKELAGILKKYRKSSSFRTEVAEIAYNSQQLLKDHDAYVVAQSWLEELLGEA